MTAIGIWVADILDNCQVSIPVEIGQFTTIGMKSELVVDHMQIIFLQSQFWTQAVIVIILKGDDCIEAVITASQLDQDEDAPVLFRIRDLCRH